MAVVTWDTTHTSFLGLGFMRKGVWNPNQKFSREQEYNPAPNVGSGVSMCCPGPHIWVAITLSPLSASQHFLQS